MMLPTELKFLNFEPEFSDLYGMSARIKRGVRHSNAFLTGQPDWYSGYASELQILDAMIGANERRLTRFFGKEASPVEDIPLFRLGIDPVSRAYGNVLWAYKRANWPKPAEPQQNFDVFCCTLGEELDIPEKLVFRLIDLRGRRIDVLALDL